MKTIHNSTPKLVELGSLSADTRGQGGVILEGFTLMPKAGITAD